MLRAFEIPSAPTLGSKSFFTSLKRFTKGCKTSTSGSSQLRRNDLKRRKTHQAAINYKLRETYPVEQHACCWPQPRGRHSRSWDDRPAYSYPPAPSWSPTNKNIFNRPTIAHQSFPNRSLSELPIEQFWESGRIRNLFLDPELLSPDTDPARMEEQKN